MGRGGGSLPNTACLYVEIGGRSGGDSILGSRDEDSLLMIREGDGKRGSCLMKGDRGGQGEVGGVSQGESRGIQTLVISEKYVLALCSILNT